MYNRLAGIGSEPYQYCLLPSEALSDQRYSLGSEELPDKLRVMVSNRHLLNSGDNAGTTKCFCNHLFPVCSPLHQLIDKQFHRINAIPRIDTIQALSRQENMIHASNPPHRIMHANCYAGA